MEPQTLYSSPKIGLRFLLGGQFFAVVVSQSKAQEIIKQFRNKFDGVVYDEQDSWAVKLADVSVMHLFDPNQLQQNTNQGQNPPGVPGAPPVSGSTNVVSAW